MEQKPLRIDRKFLIGAWIDAVIEVIVHVAEERDLRARQRHLEGHAIDQNKKLLSEDALIAVGQANLTEAEFAFDLADRRWNVTSLGKTAATRFPDLVSHASGPDDDFNAFRAVANGIKQATEKEVTRRCAVNVI
jgi:hypothetical protein